MQLYHSKLAHDKESGKGFLDVNSNSKLKEHFLTIKQNKNFSCPICNSKFTFQDRYKKNHITNSTQYEIYLCDHKDSQNISKLQAQFEHFLETVPQIFPLFTVCDEITG